MQKPETSRRPWGMIAVLIILVLGLIGFLAPPASPGAALAVLTLEITIVLPLAGWAARWLLLQSQRRREEDARRRAVRSKAVRGCGTELTLCDPEFAAQMELAEQVMREDRDSLRKLAG